MRKISYMYQISGGTDHRHFCEECIHCVPMSDVTCRKDQYICAKHPEHPQWNPYWISCKKFSDTREEPKRRKKASIHQMTIMELLGAEV